MIVTVPRHLHNYFNMYKLPSSKQLCLLFLFIYLFIYLFILIFVSIMETNS